MVKSCTAWSGLHVMDWNVPCLGREGVHRKQASVRRAKAEAERARHGGHSTCASATVRVEPTPRV
uniref:Uncharacterized protein n=1 Tax=Arundo donax TaxID=35708 RepID=A0A0A8ZNL5_ARUDO